jgi:hypothetical protein
MQRNDKGQFVRGNTIASKGGRARARKLTPARRSEIARMGWNAMVDKHFAGDEMAAKRWWGSIGAWASDVMAGYAGTWMHVFHHPGPPDQFLKLEEAKRAYKQQRLNFSLRDLEELSF